MEKERVKKEKFEKERLEFLIFSVALLVSVVVFGLSRQKASAATNCDLDCLSEKVASLTRRVAVLEKATGVGGSSKIKTGSTSKTKELFLQISGGSATGSDWTKVSGTEFWFDQSLYGDVVKVTWEGWVDNGYGQVRLYDATNNRGVDGSEVSVDGSTRTSFYSQPLAIWRGQNQYYVQVKNVNLTLMTISSARLRIVGK